MGVCWIEIEFDIGHGVGIDFIVIREAVYLAVLQIHEDIVRELDTMLICMGGRRPPLEVSPAHQTGINVGMRQTDAADLLKIEVEQMFLDGAEVGTLLLRFAVHLVASVGFSY